MLNRQLYITLALLLFCFIIKGQNIPENLVFEGAGLRGIAYSGAITELEATQKLKGIKRVGGTSAGAITALALSFGYNANEITAIINSTSFRKFNDGKFFFIGGIHRLNRYYGWYRGKKFEKWLSKLIEAKTGNDDIRFRDLRSMGFKDLYVTGTCLNQQSLVIFSHETYPDMKVKDAVRISMSIPLYFEAVFIDKTGNVIPKPSLTTGLDIMVDGGFVANFPIRLFDSTRYMNIDGPNRFHPNPATIGFRLDRDEQIVHDQLKKGLAPMPVNNINDYFKAFYNLIIENLNRQVLTEADWQRTVSISDANVAPRIRKLSKEELEALITNGQKAVRRFYGQETGVNSQ